MWLVFPNRIRSNFGSNFVETFSNTIKKWSNLRAARKTFGSFVTGTFESKLLNVKKIDNFLQKVECVSIPKFLIK